MKSQSITIKQILLSNQNWWRFYEKYGSTMRIAIVICIVKLLSCKTTVRGYHEYHCSNPECAYIKRVYHTCKSKACSSCGKKATSLWIQSQNQILPVTPWQHITFTMPSELWDFFWLNRFLLNHIGKIAADCIKTIADKKSITPGIFIAIHTFSRANTRNVHVHLSTTTGGLVKNSYRWKELFFHQETLMKIWRYNIIKLFRKFQKELILPKSLQQNLNHTFTFNHFLNHLYNKYWIVHCSKPSYDHKKNVAYLGRYLKRPPIAESRLRHYDGNSVIFSFLDHRSKTYRRFKLTTTQFIARFIQHIPDIGFRMIRYYGFLAHRVRGKLLPIVYELLKQEKQFFTPTTFAQLLKQNFQLDPFVCIVCGKPLVLASIQYGQYSANGLLPLHHSLANETIA